VPESKKLKNGPVNAVSSCLCVSVLTITFERKVFFDLDIWRTGLP